LYAALGGLRFLRRARLAIVIQLLATCHLASCALSPEVVAWICANGHGAVKHPLHGAVE
jgi:hypothetical protein